MGVFERYTEEARRVVFFARYEAGRREAATISTSHIVLGLLREGHSPVASSLRLRERLEEHIKTLPLSPIVHTKDTQRDIPLDNDAKKALAYAATEADSDGSKRIEPVHLLRGLLCFDNAASETLRLAGFDLASVKAFSIAGGRGGRFVQRLRWRAFLILRESVWPAVLKLLILFVVGLLGVLLLRLLGE